PSLSTGPRSIETPTAARLSDESGSAMVLQVLENVSTRKRGSLDDRFGARPGPVRRQRRVRRTHRPLPSGAPDALLPDPRIVPRRRGPAPGDSVVRLASTRSLRRPLAPGVALPHRHQPLSQLPP